MSFDRNIGTTVLLKVSAKVAPAVTASHLRFVRQLPCCVCGRGGGVDPHHLRGYQLGRGMGKKSDDKWVVPLCRNHHNEVHTVGTKKELEWFEEYGCPYSLATQLWDNTGDISAMKRVVIGWML